MEREMNKLTTCEYCGSINKIKKLNCDKCGAPLKKSVEAKNIFPEKIVETSSYKQKENINYSNKKFRDSRDVTEMLIGMFSVPIATILITFILTFFAGEQFIWRPIFYISVPWIIVWLILIVLPLPESDGGAGFL
jgi:pilus assembly protein TadC